MEGEGLVGQPCVDESESLAQMVLRLVSKWRFIQEAVHDRDTEENRVCKQRVPGQPRQPHPVHRTEVNTPLDGAQGFFRFGVNYDG